MIGFAMCGSYCTHALALQQLISLRERGLEIQPMMSENVYATDTQFGSAEELRRKVREICDREIIHTVVGAEPLGPRTPLDALLLCPCTGNTLAKMALGITDTAVTMAAKAHLRSDRPLVICLASNDALSANLKNIGLLLSRKCVYFVPMRQDDPEKKPHSLVADFSLLIPTLDSAMQGKQYQKIFV
ncbi:MAG: dipicolinate synthase subunit B [Clostridia bacterium]|nr:dipicolinate synthase subunit B [Clostridia bacterium]